MLISSAMFCSSSTTSTRRGDPSTRVSSMATSVTTSAVSFLWPRCPGVTTFSEPLHSIATARASTMDAMSDTDQTSTREPEPPRPPPAQPASAAPYDVQHAVPPAYAAPAKERFLDRMLDMRAVIAVALAALIIGGLSGFLLGEHTGGGDDRFGRGGPGGFPGGFQPGQGAPGQQGQPPFGQPPMR